MRLTKVQRSFEDFPTSTANTKICFCTVVSVQVKHVTFEQALLRQFNCSHKLWISCVTISSTETYFVSQRSIFVAFECPWVKTRLQQIDIGWEQIASTYKCVHLY